MKAKSTDAEIFQPDEMEKILLAAPEMLLPFIALGGFAGLRVAELSRLDWSSIDLDRRMIHLRADQAKTASRRIVPISENLAAWLSHVKNREGKVITQKAVPRKSSDLAKDLGLTWPQNVLRLSFISYRLATIQDANQVALEAGNPAAIIFKHYRELVTEAAAGEWFGITPPEGWTPPEVKWNRRKRTLKDAPPCVDSADGA